MKKIAIYLFLFLLSCPALVAQVHFAGMMSTKRVGMFNAAYNPAELTNLTNKVEFNLIGTSLSFGNNKMSIMDIRSGKSPQSALFSSGTPLDLDVNVEFLGPSVGFRYKKWGFGILTKAFLKANIDDLDVNLMNSIYSNALLTLGSLPLSNPYNQRINSSSWGQVSFAASRKIVDKVNHQLSAGMAVSILFPASYANIGLTKFSGTIKYNLFPPQANLINTSTKLNLAYTSNFAKSFANPSDFTSAIWGEFGGAAVDLGLTYQYINDKKIPVIHAGMSVKNLGSLSYQAKKINVVDYNVNIPAPTATKPGFNLFSLATLSSLTQLEGLLISSGYMTKEGQSNSDVQIKLPTTVQAYVSIRALNRLNLDVNAQYNIRQGEGNKEITSPNTITVIPRFQTKYFEIYSPWSNHEVTGINGGLGIRVAGFYLGSGSIITALQSNSKQMDVFTGYQIGF
jgi:hypothetical protein